MKVTDFKKDCRYRLPEWDPNYSTNNYLFFDENKHYELTWGDGAPVNFTFTFLTRNDWELIESPEQRAIKKIQERLNCEYHMATSITPTKYKNVEDAISCLRRIIFDILKEEEL